MAIELTKWEQAKLTARLTHKRKMAQARAAWQSQLQHDMTARALEGKTHLSKKASKKIAKTAAIVTRVLSSAKP
ncbi:MAG TPA: hypothetical protein VLA31_02630 [Burkholderiaceae bacterium]|nr:hypothetical protein [Burkholderiaceae bacterium]